MCGWLKGRIRSSRVHSDWAECDSAARILSDRAPVDAMAPPGDCCRHRSTLSHSPALANSLFRWFTLIKPAVVPQGR